MRHEAVVRCFVPCCAETERSRVGNTRVSLVTHYAHSQFLSRIDYLYCVGFSCGDLFTGGNTKNMCDIKSVLGNAGTARIYRKWGSLSKKKRDLEFWDIL
jgi:hypothetical protein